MRSSQLARVLLAACLLAPAAGGAQGLPETLDGTWLMRRDLPDGVARALRIEGGRVVMLWVESDGFTYAEGAWTTTASGGGVFDATMQIETSLVPGHPVEPGATHMQLRLSGPDSGEMRVEDSLARWGTLARSTCDLGVKFRNRASAPPEGCAWLEIRGVGFNGINDACEFNAGWASRWEDFLQGIDGLPMPAGCLFSVPAGFAE